MYPPPPPFVCSSRERNQVKVHLSVFVLCLRRVLDQRLFAISDSTRVEPRRPKGFGTLGAREQEYPPWTLAWSCPNRPLIANAQVQTTRSDFKYTFTRVFIFSSLWHKFINIHLFLSLRALFLSAFFRLVLQCGMYVAGQCIHLGQKPRRRYLELVKSVHCQSDSFDATSRVSRIHIFSRSYRDGSAKRLTRDAISLIVMKVTIIYLLFSY